MWLHAETRWPELLVVATPGCQSPEDLAFMVDSLGTWKPLTDFCYFLALPAVGITEILVLGQ